jgi:hypothetical protein
MAPPQGGGQGVSRWARVGVLLATAVLVGGCTTETGPDGAAPAVAVASTAVPSTTPAWQPPQALALATYDQASGGSSRTDTVVADPSDAYVVQAQCLGAARGVTLGYTVLVDEEPVSSGRVPCDGGIYRDSATAGTGKVSRYTLQLAVGTDVERAYAALVPE